MNEFFEKVLQWFTENWGTIVGILTAIATIWKGGDALILSIKKAINVSKDLHTTETLNKVNESILALQKAQAEFEQTLLEHINAQVSTTIEQYNEKKKEIAKQILASSDAETEVIEETETDTETDESEELL